MSAGIFESSTIPVLEQVVNFAQARHAVLAGNIANLDTPGYRVRDLSVETFQQRLNEAVEARRQTHEPLSPGLIGETPDDAMQRVRDSMKTILFHDGSDVGLEQQITEIAKNQALHNMAIAIMSSQFRLLQAAISERV